MVVVDASVAFKWLVDEEPFELTILARSLLERFLKGEEDILVPDILLYELGNIFSHKADLTSREIKTAWNTFQRFSLPAFSPSTDFIEKSIDFSLKHHVSVYDASYAVLAIEKKGTLLTADRKFVAAVNLPFVKDLSSYKP